MRALLLACLLGHAVSQFPNGIEQCVQGIAKCLKGLVNGLQGFACGRQLHVFSVAGQAQACGFPGRRSSLQLQRGLVESQSCDLKFSLSSGGFKVRSAQGFVGWGRLPILLGLLLVMSQLHQASLNHGQALFEFVQTLGDVVQPPCSRGGACRVADEVCAGLVPSASQGAQAKSPVRSDPRLGYQVVLQMAGDTLKQS